MQQRKRGNAHRLSKRYRHHQQGVSNRQAGRGAEAGSKPLPRARLTLHETDPITGPDDLLFTLFYEYYRGYTIYSSEDGRCCIHGQEGPLRLQGKYVCFPDVEEAKTLIQRFRAEGRSSQEHMNRFLRGDEYVCLNRRRQGNEQQLCFQ